MVKFGAFIIIIIINIVHEVQNKYKHKRKAKKKNKKASLLRLKIAASTRQILLVKRTF